MSDLPNKNDEQINDDLQEKSAIQKISDWFKDPYLNFGGLRVGIPKLSKETISNSLQLAKLSIAICGCGIDLYKENDEFKAYANRHFTQMAKSMNPFDVNNLERGLDTTLAASQFTYVVCKNTVEDVLDLDDKAINDDVMLAEDEDGVILVEDGDDITLVKSVDDVDVAPEDFLEGGVEKYLHFDLQADTEEPIIKLNEALESEYDGLDGV